jgi:hypothetical protein
MKVTACKSGHFSSPLATFGIRIGIENRQQYFRPEWKSIILEISENSVIEPYLTPGFWRQSPDIRHPAFRRWFTTQGLMPGRDGAPPDLNWYPSVKIGFTSATHEHRQNHDRAHGGQRSLRRRREQYVRSSPPNSWG